MTTCVATKKSDGKICGVKCKNGKLLCKRHDPEQQKEKKPSSRKQVDREKLNEVFAKVAKKIGYVPTPEDLEQKRGRIDRTAILDHLPAYMNRHTAQAVKKYALSGVDLVPYAGVFPRKVWMIISWHISSDLKAYQNVAMLCKKLYDLFVRQKVTWYYHPLQGTMKSPMQYQFPIFRVLEFHIPKDMNELLKAAKLPSIDDVVKQYELSDGKSDTAFEAGRRRTEVIIELAKSLIRKEMKEDDEFEEEITGGGIFSDTTSANKIKFNDPTIKWKVFKMGNSYYVMIKPQKGVSASELQKKAVKSFCTYTGISIVQLMKLD
jgi:hypothetical protein